MLSWKKPPSSLLVAKTQKNNITIQTTQEEKQFQSKVAQPIKKNKWCFK